MAELSLEQMTDTYADVLKEIGNIGAGNAMTALSQMLNCKIDMQVPQVKLLDLSNVATIVGSEEQRCYFLFDIRYSLRIMGIPWCRIM